MLFCVSSDDKTFDIWGAPVSWKQMRTTGPAVLIFKDWSRIPSGGSCTPGAWSPDGKKIAILQKGEIWLTTPGGSEPTGLKVPEVRGRRLFWSPDGKILAFKTHKRGESYQDQILVFHSQDSRITKVADEAVYYFWSPDSKWVSYMGFRPVKTRPAGILWEMDIDEAFSKLAK